MSIRSSACRRRGDAPTVGRHSSALSDALPVEPAESDWLAAVRWAAATVPVVVLAQASAREMARVRATDPAVVGEWRCPSPALEFEALPSPSRWCCTTRARRAEAVPGGQPDGVVWLLHVKNG